MQILDVSNTNRCSACKTTPYCGLICQTADWPSHKEKCPGHLRKVGMANLEKAKGFGRYRNWQQTLHYAELAATKLKQIKDRPLEDLSEALNLKFNGLNLMDHNREALECAKEWYCLHLTKHTHPPAIKAGFALIESCIHNREFADAVLYAHTTWETLTLSRDSHIPGDELDSYIALGARFLAKSIWSLAVNGDASEEEKRATVREAITLARRALEMHTRLRGFVSEEVASDMGLLGSILIFFNDVDDDEVPRLFEQSTAIFAQVQGSLSGNVATGESNLGSLYQQRAIRARTANDLDRCVANYKLTLSHIREAARIFRAINGVDKADELARVIVNVEGHLRHVTAVIAATTRG